MVSARLSSSLLDLVGKILEAHSPWVLSRYLLSDPHLILFSAFCGVAEIPYYQQNNIISFDLGTLRAVNFLRVSLKLNLVDSSWM